MTLAHCLAGLRDLPVGRGFLADRLATLGPLALAQELEPLVTRAAAGNESERGAMVVVASWIAHACGRGELAPLLAIGAAAAEAGLPRTAALFGDGEARATLAKGGRLADVGVAVFANLSGFPLRPYPGQSAEEWREQRAWLSKGLGGRLRTMLPRTARVRLHHDPVFIGRLLDQPWLSMSDVVVIAVRRPTVPAIVLAVATRDRWFRYATVRAAIRQNPYTPPLLARALGVLARELPRATPPRSAAPPRSPAPRRSSPAVPAPSR